MSSYVCIAHGLPCEDGMCEKCDEEVRLQMEEGDPRDSVEVEYANDHKASVGITAAIARNNAALQTKLF